MAYLKLDHIQMKEHNKKAILRSIRNLGEASRRDLAEQTGLTTASITNLINELLSHGLVTEHCQGKSHGGRKPTLLKICPEAGYLIGVELSSSSINAVLCDFSPIILDAIQQPVDFNQKPLTIIAQMVDTIETLIEKNRIPREKIFGVGIASAGPYDRDHDFMMNPPNFNGWHAVPLIQKIKEATHLPCCFEKETSAIALAEYSFGKHSGFKRLMAVSVYEKGIGGGLVIGGDIYHGNDNVSMEIGHIQVEPNGLACSCGGVGCLEVQAAGSAAIHYANDALQKQSNKSSYYQTMQALSQSAQQGDTIVLAALGCCSQYLGLALSNVLTLLSPDILYLDGPFIESYPPLFDLVIAQIEQKTYPPNLKNIQKARFSFGALSGAMGGVAAAYASFCR